ncbi:DUF5710 domain-containing protein [Methylotenera mobilis]|uniref:DUF5710 domain-containing protein n=1 Tax=Methylotenera mobilis TaxID=359408 RepID=UPI0002F4AA6B|nr:DUF5710 domain-containing protein [Methylotenera mobilis]
MTATNIALKVPFSEKDQAKALGAKWNAEAKHWYVPQGVNAEPFAKWITVGAAPSSMPAPAVKSAVKHAPAAKSAPISNDAIDDDLDAINARLRDAFEARDFE